MDSSAALPSISRRRLSEIAADGTPAGAHADVPVIEQAIVARDRRKACQAAYARLTRAEKARSAMPARQQETAVKPEHDRWHEAMTAFDDAIATLAGLQATTLAGLLAKAELVDQEDDTRDEHWDLAVSITRDLLAFGRGREAAQRPR